jgi:hypothetical protein
MKTKMTLQGADRFQRNLAKMSEELGREVESVLRQEARALCTAVGAVTEPRGFQDSMAEAFRKRVEGQVRRVFASRANIWAVSEFMKRRSVQLGLAFYRAAKAGKVTQARRYLREAGVTVEQIDKALHRKARSGPNANVPKGTVFEAVVPEPSLRKYVREKRGLVGLAKAAWYVAAKALGGRVRRNIVEADGKRRTEEIFPGYLRKLARRFPGIGGASVSPRRVEVWSNITYARYAVDDYKFEEAVRMSEESFRRSLGKSVDALTRRYFKDAA